MSTETMALAHTILMVLASSPYSGYELGKEFDETVSCYWSASSQQVYRELGKMEDKHWVHAETVPQVGRPDKKVYSITETGQQTLIDWVLEPAHPAPIREDLLVKVRASYLLSNQPVILDELERRRQIHQTKLGHYRDIEQTTYADVDHLSDREFAKYLTLKRGIRYEQAWVEWCDDVSELLRRRFEASTDDSINP